MSLQVWLPLTEDLRNQGLLNLPTPLYDSRVRFTNGKLGQYCYGDCAIYHIGQEWLGNTWSLACWVKSSNWGPYNDIILCKNTTSSSEAQFYFSIIGGSQLNIGCNAGSETLVASYTFATNTWYHVAATYNGTTLKLYLNGNEIASKAYVSVQKTGMNNLGIGCRSQNTDGTSATGQASKCMNDVRIYDHALSPLEVKRLAQGLVLHYPLNRGGFGGDNLLKNSHNKYDNNGYYVGTYTFVDSSKLETGKTYTLSFNGELQDDTQTGWYFNIFPSPYTAIINKPTDKEGRFAFSFVMPENGGNRTSIGCYSLPLGNRLGCAIWDVKLEEGSTATPWTPASSDDLYSQMGLDNNIEYDCSGYGNNGTRVGTFSWSGDTPRYSVSTVFDGSNYISRTSLTADILTFSCWVKTSKNKSTSQIIVADSTSQLCISFYAGTIITFYGSSGYGTGSKCILGNEYKENDWNHIVVVKTGTDTRKVYCNGIEQVATSNDYWASQSTGFTVGRRETSTPHIFYGQLSDLRVYATALSADDVMALYKNAGYVDSDGNVYAYEMTE